MSRSACPCGEPVAFSDRQGRGRTLTYCDACRAKARVDAKVRYRARQKAKGAPRPFLWDQHKMTEADYGAMFDAQGGRCAGCDRTPPIAGKGLHIDHDHRCCPQSGRSCASCRRGLLCTECNLGLGLLRDDPTVLRTLALYIDRYRVNQ